LGVRRAALEILVPKMKLQTTSPMPVALQEY
jgi:hypothetical protein